jgi:hypothetical protein
MKKKYYFLIQKQVSRRKLVEKQIASEKGFSQIYRKIGIPHKCTSVKIKEKKAKYKKRERLKVREKYRQRER